RTQAVTDRRMDARTRAGGRVRHVLEQSGDTPDAACTPGGRRNISICALCRMTARKAYGLSTLLKEPRLDMRLPIFTRSFAMLVLAGVAGLAAAWAAKQHIDGRVQQLEAQARTPMVERIVAAYDLPVGTRL